MKQISAALAAVCGAISLTIAVLLERQEHATRVFIHRLDAGANAGISYVRVTTAGGMWVLTVLFAVIAIVTLLASGKRPSLFGSTVAASLLLVASVVLDFIALQASPGGLGGTEFPRNGSGGDAEFKSWGGTELERGVWLSAVAAGLAFITAALALRRSTQPNISPEHAVQVGENATDANGTARIFVRESPLASMLFEAKSLWHLHPKWFMAACFAIPIVVAVEVLDVTCDWPGGVGFSIGVGL